MNTDSSTEIPEVVTTEPQDVRNTRRTMHLHDAILKVCKVSDDQFTDDIRGFVGDTVSHDRMFEEIWVENPAGDWVSQDKSLVLCCSEYGAGYGQLDWEGSIADLLESNLMPMDKYIEWLKEKQLQLVEDIDDLEPGYCDEDYRLSRIWYLYGVINTLDEYDRPERIDWQTEGF